MKTQNSHGPQSPANEGAKISGTPLQWSRLASGPSARATTTTKALTKGSALSRAVADPADSIGSRSGQGQSAVDEPYGTTTETEPPFSEGVSATVYHHRSDQSPTEPQGQSDAVEPYGTTAQTEPHFSESASGTAICDGQCPTESRLPKAISKQKMRRAKLTVAQLNAHHSKAATANLQKHLDQLGPMSIGLIQEPWHIHGAVKGLSNPSRTVYAATMPGDTAPRAVVTCTKDLSPMFVPQASSRDLAVVQLTMRLPGKGNQLVTVASAYLAGDEPIPHQALIDLSTLCHRTKSELIIGFDANAHHVIWGSTDTNQRGSELLELLTQQNWHLLNQGCCPTFVTAVRSEVLDITICTPGLCKIITDWKVSDQHMLSDHRMLEFSVQKAKVEQRWTRNVRKTNWDQYVTVLDQELPKEVIHPQSSEETENYSQSIANAVTDAFQRSCKATRNTGKRAPPWWNEHTKTELSQLKRQSQDAFKAFLAHKTPNNWKASKAASRLYMGAIRRAKRQSWRRFCHEVSTSAETGRMSKILRMGPQTAMGLLERPDGSTTTNASETLSHLLEIHFPNCKIGESPVETARTPTSRCWDMACQIVTEHALSGAVKSLLPYKAPGPDDIFPVLLQKGYGLLAPHLLQLYRASLYWGYLPRSWRLAKVVFIPKPGKPTYAKAKSWRPISLSSFVLKVAEKMVDRYLKMRYLVKHPLHQHQHAYQAGKSTETALHSFLAKVQDTLDNKHYALACFLDIQGAFDNAQFCDVKRALKGRGVCPVIQDWATNLLQQRAVLATAGTATCSALTTQGTAQGGVLSALWFVLVIDELLCRLNNQRYFTIGYSDDTTILLTGPDLGTLCELMQLALNSVQRWCAQSKMGISPEKTQMMLFTRKYKLQGLKTVRLAGVPLELVNQVKYLGLYLDPKLHWNEHIRLKSVATYRALWQCRQAVRNTWGLTPRVSKYLYECIVRPMLTYGCLFWAKDAAKARSTQQLSKVQRLGCLMIMSALRSTPLSAIEALSGVMPLDLHLRYRALCTAHRLSSLGKGPRRGHALTGYRVFFRDLKSQRCPAKTDVISAWLTPTPRYHLVDPQRHLNTDIQDDPVDCSIWGQVISTAGAEPHVYGAYRVTTDLIEVYQLPSYCTAWQAEQYAAVQLVKYLKTMPGNRQVRMYFSNQSHWQALQVHKVVTQQLRDLLKNLNEIAGVVPLCISYRVNTLAPELQDMQQSIEEYNAQQTDKIRAVEVGALLLQVKRQIYGNIWRENAKRWASGHGCRQTHLFLGRTLPSNDEKSLLMSLPRQHLYALVGILTGHTILNRHLCLLGIVDSDACQMCHTSESETSEHFVGYCQKFSRLRQEIFGYEEIEPSFTRNRWPMLLNFILTSRRFDID